MEFNLSGLIVTTIVTLANTFGLWLFLGLVAWTLVTVYYLGNHLTYEEGFVNAVKKHKNKVISVVILWFLFIAFSTMASTFKPRITAGNTQPTYTNDLVKSLKDKKDFNTTNPERSNIEEKMRKEMEESPDTFESFRKQREGLN